MKEGNGGKFNILNKIFFKVFNVDGCPVYLFFLLFVLLVSHLRNHCLTQDYEDNQDVCFLLIVSTLTFRSMVFFKLAFVYCIREGFNFIFCTAYPVVSAPLLK